MGWKHKYNIGDKITYKHSEKVLQIFKIMEDPYQYKCIDVKTEKPLSAIFNENELID